MQGGGCASSASGIIQPQPISWSVRLQNVTKYILFLRNKSLYFPLTELKMFLSNVW